MYSPANILTTSRLWSCCSQSPHFLSQISVAKPLPLAEKVPKWNPFPSPAHFSSRKRQALSVIDNVSFFKHFTQPFESVPRCQQWYYLLISKSTGAPLCLFSILILHPLTSTQCWSHPLQRQTCLPFFFLFSPFCYREPGSFQFGLSWNLISRSLHMSVAFLSLLINLKFQKYCFWSQVFYLSNFGAYGNHFEYMLIH